jgi:hypothetical protein
MSNPHSTVQYQSRNTATAFSAASFIMAHLQQFSAQDSDTGSSITHFIILNFGNVH